MSIYIGATALNTLLLGSFPFAAILILLSPFRKKVLPYVLAALLLNPLAVMIWYWKVGDLKCWWQYPEYDQPVHGGRHPYEVCQDKWFD